MRTKISEDEYAEYLNQVATSKVVKVIKEYFKGDVDRFYAAPCKWNSWNKRREQHKLSLDEQTASFVNSVYRGIRHCNLAGIEKKYVKSIMGHNYYVAGFMKRIKEILKEEYGYKIIPRGTLPYKGENHPYCTKYLPPKDKIKKIFESEEMVDIVIRSSSYCNKVKKVIQTMQTDYMKKAGKDVSSWGRDKANQRGAFMSPEHLLGRLWAFLQKGDAGTPMGYYNVLKPIVTDYLYNSFKKEWLNETSQSIQNKYVGDDMMTNEERKAIAKKQLKFVMKIRKQLDSPKASKMFKDEKIGENIFKPADEKRIAKASEAVDQKIARLNEIINGKIVD